MVPHAKSGFWRGLAPYLLSSILLISAYMHVGAVKVAASSLAVIGIPIHFVASLPSMTLAAMQGRLTTTEQLRRQFESLRAQNLILRARLQRFEFLENENNRLREALQAAPQAVEKVTLAQLVAVDPELGSLTVLVNKGSADDVYIGQPVIDAGGIVGQVTKSSLFTSKISLITEESQAVPVQVVRSGVRAILYGGGKNRTLRVMYLDRNVDIQPDDVLVSSGLGEIYPPGYPVAVVTAVERNVAESFMNIEARPMSHLSRDREVLLLWPTQLKSSDHGSDPMVEEKSE